MNNIAVNVPDCQLKRIEDAMIGIHLGEPAPNAMIPAVPNTDNANFRPRLFNVFVGFPNPPPTRPLNDGNGVDLLLAQLSVD